MPRNEARDTPARPYRPAVCDLFASLRGAGRIFLILRFFPVHHGNLLNYVVEYTKVFLTQFGLRKDLEFE